MRTTTISALVLSTVSGRRPRRALASLLVLALIATSCRLGVGGGTGSVAGDVVDCTVGVARQHSDEYGSLVEAVLRAATDAEGAVDWATVRAAVGGFGKETGGCVLATVVARLIALGGEDARNSLSSSAPSPAPPRSSRESARLILLDGFNEIRSSVLGSARFRTSSGEL